jgi:hypothetical protein
MVIQIKPPAQIPMVLSYTILPKFGERHVCRPSAEQLYQLAKAENLWLDILVSFSDMIPFPGNHGSADYEDTD